MLSVIGREFWIWRGVGRGWRRWPGWMLGEAGADGLRGFAARAVLRERGRLSEVRIVLDFLVGWDADRVRGWSGELS